LRRRFQVDQLSFDERNHLKQHLFDELLIRTEHVPTKTNAIEEEQRDFVAAIRTGKMPRVDGLAGRDAVAVAGRILESINDHAWDGTSAGRHGPFAMPALPIIPAAERWQDDTATRRKAG
jgi:predicted dehydrogenase